MQRRDLLRKLGLGAFMVPAMVGALAAEPKPETGEWYMDGNPICPECTYHMVVQREKDGTLWFSHPSHGPDGYTVDGYKYPCKNAGRKFLIPKQQLEEIK